MLKNYIDQPFTAVRISLEQFPMLDGPPIPWALAEVLYAGYSARYGTGQSLERIAERGGFGWSEIPLWWGDLRDRRFYEAIQALKIPA